MRLCGSNAPGSGAGIFTGHSLSRALSPLVMLARATLSWRGREGSAPALASTAFRSSSTVGPAVVPRAATDVPAELTARIPTGAGAATRAAPFPESPGTAPPVVAEAPADPLSAQPAPATMI